MTATPELEGSPDIETPAEAPAAPLAPPAPMVPLQRSPARLVRSALPWGRLVALLIVAALTQVIYVFLWPLSYFMTQAPEYTYQYLVQYPAAWERLLVLLARF